MIKIFYLGLKHDKMKKDIPFIITLNVILNSKLDSNFSSFIYLEEPIMKKIYVQDILQ